MDVAGSEADSGRVQGAWIPMQTMRGAPTCAAVTLEVDLGALATATVSIADHTEGETDVAVDRPVVSGLCRRMLGQKI
jgi:hypothetical protein